MAGVYRGDVTLGKTSDMLAGKSKPFTSVCFTDTSVSRLKAGTFGVLARNCPGVFANPVWYEAPVATSASGKSSADYPGFSYDEGTSQTVTLFGGVAHPGIYSVTSDMRLSDLYAKAGGRVVGTVDIVGRPYWLLEMTPKED